MVLYDSIGKGYDTTRRADPYITGRLLHYLAPVCSGRYIDFACGTGNYTVALKQAGLAMAGLDASDLMLEAARRKDASVTWLRGDIEATPLADGSYNGGICVLAIHHFANLENAFKEMRRVIGSGTLVIFTSTAEQMERFWLNRYFPEAMRRSIVQMPSKIAIESALRKAGFTNIAWENYSIREDLQDFFLYSGKFRPEIYLDEGVRAGISTFASLTNPAEIERGCSMLKRDIGSTEVLRVMDSYQNQQAGDYAFVAAQA